MQASKKLLRHAAPEYTNLGILVDNYEVQATASINHHAYEPQYAWRDPNEESLHNFLTHIVITGTATTPSARAGKVYELTIYSEDSPVADTYSRLKDIQRRDDHNTPEYRTYRGKDIPVYSPPTGFGTLSKVQREDRWTGALFVRPHFVTDMLILLTHGRPLFLGIVEVKVERQRWLRGLSLQTNNPADE